MRPEGVRLALVSGLFTGLIKPGPGTWGSLAASAAWFAAACATGGVTLWLFTAVGVVGASAVCVWLGPWAEARAGKSDPQFVVADEWAGQWLSLLAVAAVPVVPATTGWRLASAAVGLVWFRVFDITKPPPCRQLERLPAGWGVLADDLAAGAYAGIASVASLFAAQHVVL